MSLNILSFQKRLTWTRTLKFRIVAMAVVTGVLSAVVATHLVLTTTQANMQRMLLEGEGDEVEITAALLGTKIDMLRDALKAVAHRASPELWQSSDAMTTFLVNKPALTTLFDSVFAARADGQMLTRVVRSEPAGELVNVADRIYFQQALKTDQPVLSDPLAGKLVHNPAVVIAISAMGSDNQINGVLAGVLGLSSTNLFSEVTRIIHEEGSRVLIMSRSGVILAHTDAEKLLTHAREEPGLMEVYSRWHASGSPIDTTGAATESQGNLVAMAGIPDSDWTLVRLKPLAIVLQPIQAARTTAWIAAVAVGCSIALLAGGLAWHLTRPISKLRSRARDMLVEGDESTEGWPQGSDEVGQLAHAFQGVLEQRRQKQTQTQALLVQLEAILDHAEVGIAFTRNGNFELVSRQFCELFGAQKDQLVGEPARIIRPSEQAYQVFSDLVVPAFLHHGAFNGEARLVRRNGVEFWGHLRGRAVVGGDRSKGTIWTVEDITESREHRERLTWTASHDALTGLANRAAFEELLAAATERAGIQSFCVMFLDLDHFKQVNDTGGHAAGDALLRDVAQTMSAQLRQTDTVARLGGDEFAVLLPGCPLPQAREIGEKLRSAVVAYRLNWEGRPFNVGVSIGLVSIDASYVSMAAILRDADTACYAAKQRGRNALVVFDPLEN